MIKNKIKMVSLEYEFESYVDAVLASFLINSNASFSGVFFNSGFFSVSVCGAANACSDIGCC